MQLCTNIVWGREKYVEYILSERNVRVALISTIINEPHLIKLFKVSLIVVYKAYCCKRRHKTHAVLFQIVLYL